ncbi:MAG: two-component sensor histidine kinase [Bacteroidetes bacterium MedPE-SWsnd-G2]|nr:MAG: two-component sensor histidine kinase [Bacteroidetes bacterium MedPE-SWsnd-G2]
MTIVKNRNVIRWIIIIASFFIISLILWNTYIFFQNFKNEERIKMENWSFAQQNFINSNSDDEIEVTSRILESNKTTPMILTDEKGNVISTNNIEDDRLSDPEFTKKLISKFESENAPIRVKLKDEWVNTIYYGDSVLLNKLKYYPLALLLIIFLFMAVVFFFYRSSKNASQNKLWTGMAKETAHQIGTPLSSLVGWTEILRSEQVNPEYIKEIEKDINRLQTITERFSKIGSKPKLERAEIVEETTIAVDYLKSRSSKLITFSLEVPNSEIYVNLNKQLFSWTIENLVKNGIDAMKGKGSLSIAIVPYDKHVKITVTDSGKGIPKHLQSQIFEPGFTTKTRGWGLGLSLSKRIIEDYHKGRLKVAQSEIGKGTTMQISLKRL